MIAYLVFRLLIVLLAIIPFRLMYVLSNGVAWILRVVVKYRLQVIKINLNYVFPELEGEKLQSVVKDTYRNLTDIILESIKSFSSSDHEINKRHAFIDIPSEIQEYYNQGRDIMQFAAHYNNWEWAAVSLQTQMPHRSIALMKPLKNQRVHNYITKQREKKGLGLVSIYDEEKKLIHEQSEHPKAPAFMADQNPSKVTKSLKLSFLGKPTMALHGGETYARRHNTPVYYLKSTRIKRGYYQVTPILITDNPDALPYGQITQRYFDILFDQIKEVPGDWLWTHKRWKREGIY